jgi:hypothetical protein
MLFRRQLFVGFAPPRSGFGLRLDSQSPRWFVRLRAENQTSSLPTPDAVSPVYRRLEPGDLQCLPPGCWYQPLHALQGVRLVRDRAAP